MIWPTSVAPPALLSRRVLGSAHLFRRAAGFASVSMALLRGDAMVSVRSVDIDVAKSRNKKYSSKGSQHIATTFDRFMYICVCA